MLKSGGVSTGSAVGYERLRAEVEREVQIGNKVVVVVSAPAREGERRENSVTELLRRFSQQEDTLERICYFYEAIAEPLGLSFDRKTFNEDITSAKRLDDILYLGEHIQKIVLGVFRNGQNSRVLFLDLFE